jgi:hypothetical protein
MSDLPAWAENFQYGDQEIHLSVYYSPRDYDDAIQFLTTVMGNGGDIDYVEQT